MAAIVALGRRAIALPLDVGDIGSFDAFARRVEEALANQWQRDRFDQLVNNAVPDCMRTSCRRPKPSSTSR